MDGLMKWLEKYVIPVAAKIGSIRWLVALRDAFIGTLPATMTGSLVLLINVFVNTFPASWGWTGFVKATQPIVAIDGLVYNGTIAVFALVFAFSWATICQRPTVLMI